jgi:hypothetical protein
MSAPTLVFFHVPKTGGSSLEAIMLREYQSAIGTSNWAKDADASRAGLRGALAGTLPPLIFGHIPVFARDELPADSEWLTLLRDPVERVLSQYYYGKRPPTRPFREFLEEDPDNLQTRMLSGLDPFAGPADETMLEAAKATLRDQFALVGLTERFDETLALAAWKWGWSALLYRRIRVGNNRRRRDEMHAEDIKLVEERERLDIALYEDAAEQFDAALARDAEQVQFDLEALRRASAAFPEIAEDPEPEDWRFTDLPRQVSARERLVRLRSAGGAPEEVALRARVEQIAVYSALGSERARADRLGAEGKADKRVLRRDRTIERLREAKGELLQEVKSQRRELKRLRVLNERSSAEIERLRASRRQDPAEPGPSL